VNRKTKSGGSTQSGHVERLEDCDESQTHRSLGPLERFASLATTFAGSSWAFAAALGFLVLWAASGPLFGFSENWQLVVNTGTTIITFLMVFLIQRTQNKDSRALHLKLNELLAATQGASNRLLNVEDFSEEQLATLHQHFAELSRLAKDDGDLTRSHSIEEAERRHSAKHESSPAARS
jgi:low affinity Fe/Cu permease